TGDERSTVVRQRTAVASSPTGTRIEIAVEDEVIGDGDERLPTRTPGSPAPTRPPWTEVPTGPTGPMDSPFGGRIGVIVGPPHTLGAAPRHLAIGDFDNDGVQDVAISGNSDLIVTALSAGDGSFSALISLPTGRVAGDLSLLHANDDALLDIAAATYTTAGLPSGVLVLTHREPVSQPLVVSSTPPAARLFTADLDDDGDVDIATANQPSLRPGAPDISLMLNRGHNRGFDAAVDYDVAEWTSAPLDIEGADFDVDGDIDLLVLERSVEAPQHLIAFFHDEDGWRPQSILVGPHVVAMAVADIDVDGAADIILASSSTASPNHSIVVLRNDGRDDPAGDLSFTALPPVHWQCPVGGGGLPISCSVTDIGAGDFNADGLADVVAMIDTRLQDDVPLQTPGIAVFFDSVGAGELVFSTSVNVGSGPTEIAVGDVTGDAMPDVVVAETRAGTVSIVRSVRPPARSDGNPCYVARQCQSSSCVDGICCVSASCPDDKRCDIPGHSGACMTPSEDGRRCELAEHCASGACVDGFCCASAACPDGLFCNTGACALPAELGVACGSDAMCAGGDCVDGVCCEQQCPFGESCHIPSHEGQCAARLDLGDGCDSDSQCRSTACTDGVCCQVHDCGPGRSCAVAPGEGFCDLPPAPPPPPTTNPTPQPVGFPCDRPERCGSTFCVDGTCCDSTACPAHHYCDITIHAGHCAPRQELAACCNLDSDCVTGNCEYDAPERPVRCVGACAPPRTPTPRWPGSPCDSVEQCAAGFVCNHAEGGVCCDLERCPGGESCRVPGHEGLCRVVPTPTPVRLPLGGPCSPNHSQACASGGCVNGVCCAEPTCALGERCDIFGAEGRCLPPLQAGFACATNTDCLPGLQCRNTDGTGFRCFFLSVTPTPLPTAVSTAFIAATLAVGGDRAGYESGCAVSATPDACASWLLGLLAAWRVVRRGRSRSGG
ncbi:MAG TPA: VCBS repeat-containing protein, partial [Terriglobales bacterium]|nr:VCBS repeat-containing protein [Terriglobales bacterium]